MPYAEPFKHDWSCAHKCLGCARIGPKFPCKMDGEPVVKCGDCKKEFKSQECFTNHIEKRGGHKSVCERHQKCEKCGELFANKSRPKHGPRHICGERYCRRCRGYHGPRPCFIQPYVFEEGAERRFVLHDAECTTNLQPDPLIMRFKHIVNFIFAHVFCTICLRNGTWDQPLEKPCVICGPHRFFSWSVADYVQTKVAEVKFVSNNPLGDFAQFLLTNWKKKGAKQGAGKRGKGKRARGGRKRQQSRGKAASNNPFLDLEAPDDGDDYDSAEDQDVLELLGHDYRIESDAEEEEGDADMASQTDGEEDFMEGEEEDDPMENSNNNSPTRPNVIEGFLERQPISSPTVLDNEEPGPSTSAQALNEVEEEEEPICPQEQLLRDMIARAEETGSYRDHIPGLEKELEELKRKKEEAKKRIERRKKMEIKTYAYAHYGSKYDNVLLYGEMLRMGYCPKVIKQGSKLFQVEIRRRRNVTPTILRDTYNLIPIRLEQFVGTFDLKIPGTEMKQFFPYKFNKNENLGTVLEHLPAKEDYCMGGMKRKRREQFEQWYAENYNTRFELREILADYCASDVRILAHGFVKMREIFFAATQMDITTAITYSSACMRYFRSTLQDQQLALTPQLGYEHYGRQSELARKYLKWLEQKHGVAIRSIESKEGEKRYKKWSLDGYIERAEKEGGPIAIEIYGCFWHACKKCNPGITEEHFLGRKRAGKIWEKDLIRSTDIRQKMHLWVIWECQINEELERDPEAQCFFDNCQNVGGQIKLRDAFMGGRTQGEWLYAKASEDPSAEAIQEANNLAVAQEDVSRIHTTIKVKDVKSLYPFVNFSTLYPVVHPQLDEKEMDVNWQTPDDLPGGEQIMKVFVVPPRHCDIPVLPNRHGKDSRLLFSQCRKCSLDYKGGLRDLDYSCPHTEDQVRGFIGTYTSIELRAALKSGYRIIRHYRSYRWDNYAQDFSQDLFKPYIRNIMRLKYIAEGWPAEITAEELEEAERELKKIEYVLEAKERYGIEFTAEEVEWNAGLKYVVKLLLNSLWGRFGLRNTLSTTIFVNNQVQLAKLLNDRRLVVQQVEQVTERIFMVVYKTKEEYIMENDCSNVIIALWTTSAARCHLLEQMQKLLKRPDVRILYYDTDSIFYQYDTHKGDPMIDGKHLGEMTDQYPGHRILEYICLAPKLYSLMMLNLRTGAIEFETKAKGFPLDCENAEVLNHQTMREQVMALLEGKEMDPIVCRYPDNNFRSNNRGEIYTVPLQKELQPVISKGVLIGHGRLAPFGWSKMDTPENTEYYRDHEPPNNLERLEHSRYEYIFN